MPIRRTSVGTALAVLFGSVSLLGAGAAPAAADSSTNLYVSPSSAQDIVVDGVHRRVFVSSPTGAKIIAADYNGKVVGGITDIPGASGMALSADSATLYVALRDAAAIAAIDTATLKVTARYETGAGTAPENVALAGGKLWFGYEKPGGGGDIGALDLAGAKPSVALNQAAEAAGMWKTAPELASTPAVPGLLVAGAKVGTSQRKPAVLAVYDVASGAARHKAQRSDILLGAGMEDFEVAPDGRNVVVADPLGGFHRTFSTSDLSFTAGYPASAYSNAIDIAPDGSVAAGGQLMTSSGGSDWQGSRVDVFRPGTDKAVRAFDFPWGDGQASDLSEDGLAWAPDSSRLFALTSDPLGGFLTLRVLNDPAKPVKATTKINVSVPRDAARGKELAVTGDVLSALPFTGPGTVEVTRTDIAAPQGVSLGSHPLSDSGTFYFTDTPSAGGKVTYTVRYKGDAEHVRSTGSASVEVSRTKTSLALNGDGKAYAYGTKATFTAHLGKTWKNRTVSVYAQPTGGVQKLVKTGTVNGKGDLSVTYPLTKNTTFTASYAGDARSAPAKDASKVTTRARTR
ncbi:Ig-like domain repeat protein [Streptomyces sp. NBC_01142]|uniref:Ig-like domain repeat protein n=1 Tax=Streptomyces sp. NBC_01142 TaxID=2975865 RepID=UPI00224F3458|nr:Ig-like domain repeat protein [Streptomyces sp. NBC_01142]MCX4823755.1 Ig-like domain repeat protein [Streptomyces sp. NBC_01142]